MKNLRLKMLTGVLFIVVSLISGCLSSCSEDNDSSNSAPKITSVSKTAVYAADGETPERVIDSLTSQGHAGESFIIRGSGFKTLKKLYFNDFDTYFNPTLVTDTVIIVTINRETPYADVSNQLKIVTETGSAVFDFVVAPPAPVINSYNSINANPDDEITIYGSYFLEPVVKFGDIPATVVNYSLTQIVVKVPEGAQHKYVSVATISGSAISKQAVGTAIFDDVFYGDWAMTPPATVVAADATKTASQGLKLIEGAADGWGSIGTNWIWNDQLSEYKGLRIAIKGKNAGKVAIIFNGHWDDSISALLDITTEWQTFEIPWATFGGAPQIQNITIKNNTGDANIFYVDDIGYVLND